MGFVIFTAGFTVIVWVGGLGSLTPALSTAVSEATKIPAELNATGSGISIPLVVGIPRERYRAFFFPVPAASLAPPAKLTVPRAVMVVTPFTGLGRTVEIVPMGG